MKHLPWVFVGLVSAGIVAGCASSVTSQAPMTRAARSTFQPFTTESGETRFVIQNIYFASESPERNNIHFDAWLQEWLREFDYCGKGFDILWRKTEPFEANASAGGRLVTMGRCK